MNRLRTLSLTTMFPVGLALAWHTACSGDFASVDVAIDAGAIDSAVADGGVVPIDAGVPVDGGGGADAGSDGAVGDAGMDTGTDSGPVDAGPPVPIKISSGGAPGLGLAVNASKVFWTEYSPAALRTCLLSGCATLPPALFAITVGTSIPDGIVTASVGGTDYVFYTDNQGPTNNTLWRMKSDGSMREKWGASNYTGPGAIATDGTLVFWGTSNGVFRSSAAAMGETNVLATIPSAPPPMHGLAVDSTNVYAVGTSKIAACAKAGSCASAGEVTIASISGARAIASDDANVFFIGGGTTAVVGASDLLYRCPKSGCGGSLPAPLATVALTATVTGQVHDAIAVDATNVYWGSFNKKIVYCGKGDVAPCTPKTLVDAASPRAFAQDAANLYWIEQNGDVWKIRKP